MARSTHQYKINLTTYAGTKRNEGRPRHLTVEIRLTIDLEAIATRLAHRALDSKSRAATALDGLIVAKVTE
jgi:hypothetical protein